MIPNHVPMAAVYLNTQATGSRDGRLSSRPVIAWEDDGTPMVCFDTRLRWASDHLAYPDTELLGIWQNGWRPTYDEMSTLLPDRTPGAPDPLAVHVTVRETPTGWLAHRTDSGMIIDEHASYEQLEQRLTVVLGSVVIDAIVALTDIDADDEV